MIKNANVNTNTNVNTMKTWIDERPWEVMIAESVKPTGQYEDIVQMILRDDKIFNGNSTIYDTEVWRRKTTLKDLEFQKGILEKALNQAAEQREQANDLERQMKEYQNEIDKTPHHKKQEVKEFENIKYRLEQRVKALKEAARQLEEQNTSKLDEICTEIAKLEMSLEYWLEYQDIAVKQFISLRRTIQHYKRTDDVTFLRKGVHWTCAYADKLTANLPKIS